MMEDFSKIKKIIDFAREEGLKSFAIEDESMSVSFEFADSGTCAVPVRSDSMKAEESLKTGSVYIDSPLDGKFYRTPSPDADPYVQPGSKVAENDTVCIIEAMKVMNEIVAESSGRVALILCENGDDVRAGQHLILIEPA